MKRSVLICGAGPVGLVLGIKLLQLGVPVQLIDKGLQPDRYSKALSLNSATLELMNEMGIIEPILDQAFINQNIYIHWYHQLLHRISLKSVHSKYPFFAMIPQFKTEELLAQRFQQLGGIIQRGTKLVDLVQCPDYVTASIKNLSTGQRFERDYVYVIGCDGSKSTVRTLAKIPFQGQNFGISFIMMDALTNWGKRTGKMIYAVQNNRFAIQIPMNNGMHRILISLKGTVDRKRDLNYNDFRLLLNEMGFYNLFFENPVWTSAAPIFNRLVDYFQSGRIFLAGDAAHLFSPIGGQGLNTGVQDAKSLAWRLKACLNSPRLSFLLQEYATRRRNYALKVKWWTDNLTHLISRNERNENGLLAHFLPDNPNNHYLKTVLPALLSGTS